MNNDINFNSGDTISSSSYVATKAKSNPRIDALTAFVVFWAKASDSGEEDKDRLAKGWYRYGVGNVQSKLHPGDPMCLMNGSTLEAADHLCYQGASDAALLVEARGLPLSEVACAVLSEDVAFVTEFNGSRCSLRWCATQFPRFGITRAFYVSKVDRRLLMEPKSINFSLLSSILSSP